MSKWAFSAASTSLRLMNTKSMPHLKSLLLVLQNRGITYMKSLAMHLNCFQGICGGIIEKRKYVYIWQYVSDFGQDRVVEQFMNHNQIKGGSLI